MVDWDHHHTGGKTSPRSRSENHNLYSYYEDDKTAENEKIERNYKKILGRTDKLTDHQDIENENDGYDAILRNDSDQNQREKEKENNDDAIIKSNNKIIECTEYVQSHRPCKTSDTIASHYDHKAEHQSQYATLNQMRRGIAVPQMHQSHLPDNHTTQNYPTEYDLEILKISQSESNSDHIGPDYKSSPSSGTGTDVGTHSTSHLQQQVPIPVPSLNRAAYNLKSSNHSPSRPRSFSSSEPQSYSGPLSFDERSVLNSPRLSHLTYSPSRSIVDTFNDDSINGSMISKITKYPNTPDGLKTKQIYENVLRYSKDPFDEKDIDNMGEFKNLEQLLNEAGDGSVEVQRLKTVMRTIMTRRKESLRLLQSSIISSN